MDHFFIPASNVGQMRSGYSIPRNRNFQCERHALGGEAHFSLSLSLSLLFLYLSQASNCDLSSSSVSLSLSHTRGHTLFIPVPRSGVRTLSFSPTNLSSLSRSLSLSPSLVVSRLLALVLPPLPPSLCIARSLHHARSRPLSPRSEIPLLINSLSTTRVGNWALRQSPCRRA
jgi:hypothetical protein